MKAAIKSGDMTPPQGIDLETLVWFANHSALGVKMTFQPQPPAFMGPEITDEQLLTKLHLFLLRAIGVHQEAIDRILKTDLFKDFKKKLQNLTKENKK